LLPLGPNGHGRIISMVPGESIDQETALARARSDLGISHTHVDWFSSYRVHHRVASRFRRGAMFLAGDSGHVHSPVGGQGMNTGLQDSHNLANLLADVAQGHLDEQALDRYESERRPVALKLVKVTDRACGVIARRGRGIALLRRGGGAVMARLAPRIREGPLGSRAGGLLGQYRIRYRFLSAESASRGWAHDAIVGLRLPRADSNLESLRSFTWQLHSYGDSPVSRPDVPDWVDGPHRFGPDPRGRLRSARLYPARPGGHVAAATPPTACTVTATVQFLDPPFRIGLTARIVSAPILVDGCVPIGSISSAPTATSLPPYRSPEERPIRRCCVQRCTLIGSSAERPIDG